MKSFKNFFRGLIPKRHTLFHLCDKKYKQWLMQRWETLKTVSNKSGHNMYKVFGVFIIIMAFNVFLIQDIMHFIQEVRMASMTCRVICGVHISPTDTTVRVYMNKNLKHNKILTWNY